MKEKILEAKHLTIQYADAEVPVIENFGFELYQNEILCIGGKSGSGKSTLVYALMEAADEYCARVKGKIRLGKKEIAYDGKPHKKRVFGWDEIALVPQASMTSFNPLYTMGKTMMEMLNIHEGKGRKAEQKERILELFSSVKLEEGIFDAYPHELSGGMKQRAAIALGMMFHPKVLILDEATTGLDLLIQAQVLGTILELKRRQEMGILFISHDRELADSFCDRRIELEAMGKG